MGKKLLIAMHLLLVATHLATSSFLQVERRDCEIVSDCESLRSEPRGPAVLLSDALLA